MENFSEKKKRGRPETIVGIMNGHAKNIWPEVKTRRSRDNRFYLTSALGPLNDSGKYENFFYNRDEGTGKMTVVSELGRVVTQFSEEMMFQLADQIYKQRMPTKMAVEYIREMRGVRKSPVDGVVKQILTVVNSSYLTQEQLNEVLERLSEICVVNAGS